METVLRLGDSSHHRRDASRQRGGGSEPEKRARCAGNIKNAAMASTVIKVILHFREQIVAAPLKPWRFSENEWLV